MPVGLREYAGYLLDLDGTVYLGDQALPGVPEAVARLRARGARVLFLSNKPLDPPEAYAHKLARLGIPASPNDVLSSPTVLAERLRREAPRARCFVIGEGVVRSALRRAGLELVGEPPADYVVVSWDRQFHYRQLAQALACLEGGARLVATNPDRTCPVPGGQLPDAGSILAAVEAASGRQCAWFAGKPSREMIDAALRRLGLEAGQCLMVGDRLETDIAMGVVAGMDTALVLTGIARPGDMAGSPYQPTYVLGSAAELVTRAVGAASNSPA